MRISDWSSDVCSSDLDLTDVAAPDRHLDRLRDAGAQRELFDIGGRHFIGFAGIERPPILGLARRIVEADPYFGQAGRSEERRGGKECVSKVRSRWSPYH